MCKCIKYKDQKCNYSNYILIKNTTISHSLSLLHAHKRDTTQKKTLPYILSLSLSYSLW